MPRGEYAVRAARPADLDQVVTLISALQDHIEASRADLWKMKPQARVNLKGVLAARLRAPLSCALVAEHEQDGIVGVILGRVIENNRYSPSRTGSVDQAFVCTRHRRKGVGTQLVAELCRFFDAEGVAELSLRYVDGNHEAARFWAALGFSPRIVTSGANLEQVRQYLAKRSGHQSCTPAIC